MIRTPAQHNTTSPPGQVHFEKPLQRHIEDYAQEQAQKAVEEAFEGGYRVGYQKALIDARRLQQLEPSSEAAR